MKFLPILILLMVFTSCSQQETIDVSKEAALIKTVLSKQESDWNKGDIDAFMKGYYNSEELVFIGKSGIKKGWNNTLARYRNDYPSRDKMGNLTFELIKVDVLDQDDAHVIGKYTLRNEQDSIFASGYYTLLWKKINGNWLITVDQTCG